MNEIFGLANALAVKDKRIAELECQYTEAVDAMQDRLNVRERVIAELEADNKRLEKENNLLRDTVEPRTEQLIAMAAKNKALRKACIRLICSKRYGVMRDQVVIAEDEFELFEKALQEQGEENE